MMLEWSYHWRSNYPFVSLSLHEWMYNNPRYTSEYYHNYFFKSGTHVQKEVSHIFLHHIQWQMDILIIRHDFQTLMDVIIINLICINMV
jgi:hypothetical protein